VCARDGVHRPGLLCRAGLDIAKALGITETQVVHALSYFFDHRDEILALMAPEEQAHARFTRS